MASYVRYKCMIRVLLTMLSHLQHERREIVWPHEEEWGDRNERRKVRDYLKKVWEENVETHSTRPSLENTRKEKNKILEVRQAHEFMENLLSCRDFQISGGGGIATCSLGQWTSTVSTLESGCMSSIWMPTSSHGRTIARGGGTERSMHRHQAERGPHSTLEHFLCQV